MIATEIQVKKPLGITFPHLMVHTKHQYIVYMSQESVGFIVASGTLARPNGFDSRSWDMGQFTRFKSVLLLENKE
jgi:hypothetical protein